MTIAKLEALLAAATAEDADLFVRLRYVDALKKEAPALLRVAKEARKLCDAAVPQWAPELRAALAALEAP